MGKTVSFYWGGRLVLSRYPKYRTNIWFEKYQRRKWYLESMVVALRMKAYMRIQLIIEGWKVYDIQ